MIIMFSTSFYSEFELYKTNSPNDCIEDIKNYYYNGWDYDKTKYSLIGCQDDFTADIALKICDEVVFVDDIFDDWKAVKNENASTKKKHKNVIT